MLSPGEADRRAVGRRRRRLPGRQLPGAAGRSGTAGTATPCARFWRGDGRLVGELADAAGRLQRPVRRRRPPAAPASTSSPRTTASRSHDLVSYDDKHNEANGEDNRDGDRRQRSAGTAASRARPTTRRSAPCASARCATCWSRCSCARACRMLLGRRRVRAHAARQQQRLLPGQRADLAGLGPGDNERRPWSTSPGGCCGCARTSRSSAAATSSRAGRSPAATSRTSTRSTRPAGR